MVRVDRLGLILALVLALPSEAGAVTASQPAERTAQAASAGVEPGAGIPGLTMAEVRDHSHLWREIEELQTWERSDRISIAEYRSKAIEKTAHFLGLAGAAAEEFAAVAAEAVGSVRGSFRQGRHQVGEASGSGESPFSADLDAAVDRVTALLRPEPRHRLFAPQCKKWLLRLAFGPSEAKEARESGRSR